MKKIFVLVLICFVICGCGLFKPKPEKKPVDLRAFHPRQLHQGWKKEYQVSSTGMAERRVEVWINKDWVSPYWGSLIELYKEKVIAYHYMQREFLHSYRLDTNTGRFRYSKLTRTQSMTIRDLIYNYAKQ